MFVVNKSTFIKWLNFLPENTEIINKGGITLDYYPGSVTWTIEISYENEP